jgi:hypothetical protein
MAEESPRELAAILRDAIEPRQRMKRPIAVTVLGGLFIVAGTVGLVYPLRERPLEPQIVLVSVIPVRRFVRFFHQDFRELRSAADRKGFRDLGPCCGSRSTPLRSSSQKTGRKLRKTGQALPKLSESEQPMLPSAAM